MSDTPIDCFAAGLAAGQRPALKDDVAAGGSSFLRERARGAATLGTPQGGEKVREYLERRS